MNRKICGIALLEWPFAIGCYSLAIGSLFNLNLWVCAGLQLVSIPAFIFLTNRRLNREFTQYDG